MAVIIKGTDDFTEQPKRRRRTAGGGWVEIRTWLGPLSKLDVFLSSTIAGLTPAPVDIDIIEKPICEVQAMFPDTTEDSTAQQAEAEAEATWELIPSPLDRALATHPAFSKSGTYAAWIEKIDKALRDGTAMDADWDTDAGLTNLNDYAALRTKGTDSYRSWSWIIRKTITVSKNIELEIQEDNAQKIIAYSSIGLPSNVKWKQPKLVVWDGDTESVMAVNEWMVCPPTIRVNGKKYDVTREWIGAVKWYAILYKGGSADAKGWGI